MSTRITALAELYDRREDAMLVSVAAKRVLQAQDSAEKIGAQTPMALP